MYCICLVISKFFCTSKFSFQLFCGTRNFNSVLLKETQAFSKWLGKTSLVFCERWYTVFGYKGLILEARLNVLKILWEFQTLKGSFNNMNIVCSSAIFYKLSGNINTRRYPDQQERKIRICKQDLKTNLYMHNTIGYVALTNIREASHMNFSHKKCQLYVSPDIPHPPLETLKIFSHIFSKDNAFSRFWCLNCAVSLPLAVTKIISKRIPC